MDKLSEKIISTLKSNTYNSVYQNTLAKLPIVITEEGTYINKIEIDGDLYFAVTSEDGSIKETYSSNEIQVDVKDTVFTDYNPDNVVALNKINIEKELIRKCRLVNVEKFHYDDTWYSHRCSVDNRIENFGILQVGNLPFRSLDKLVNKKSFICRMDQLIFTGIMQPFMLFINRKFVNWNNIDIVFDCDESYLLIHEDKYEYKDEDGNKKTKYIYNYYDLKDANDMYMIILPYSVEFVGTESDEIWDKNYEMLCSFLQDSLHLNNDNKIEIEVPTMYSIYKNRGMVYNVGAWLFSQLHMNYLDSLSEIRIKKLKNINLERKIYDDNGNLLEIYRTRFNAMDKDSYDMETYNKICYGDKYRIINHPTFKFNDDGILDYENGTNILTILDESLKIKRIVRKDKKIIINQSSDNETLFKESFIVFKNGKYYQECEFDYYDSNIFTINNENEDTLDIISFIPDDIEYISNHKNHFINKDFYANKILDYIHDKFIEPKTDDESKKRINDMEELLKISSNNLNYLFLDSYKYEENLNSGFNSIMNYDPLLLNDSIKTSIRSKSIRGSEANKYIIKEALKDYDKDGKLYKRDALKITRCKYTDHESYVLIFLNGELIENYSEMYVTSNYFLLPLDEEFNSDDIIELLYFTDCDNNEIHFNITDNMIAKLEESDDTKFVKTDLFKEYIKSEDIKIFADYPNNLIYKDLIEKNNDIAFNISYRNTNKDLLVFKDEIENKNNNLTAVSSRKFIYERLYVDQKAYRIKLGERFRYCDNQKQYMLFINGRRMEDDTFLITIPKYTRPFWGMFLYTAKFVEPGDRIEIFYVPEELNNINTEEVAPSTFNIDGYIETEKENLKVPYTGDFYLYFVNGKKIPNDDIIPVDSHTVKLKSNPGSLLKLNINPVYRDINNNIAKYMQSSSISKYDKFIDIIKEKFTYYWLDRLFDAQIKISQNPTEEEVNKLKTNVGTIALVNEIVRDFWVTGGVEYNKIDDSGNGFVIYDKEHDDSFIYDYNLDEYIKTDNNGNILLPSLDAPLVINIKKNDIILEYIDTYKYMTNEAYGINIFEIGRVLEGIRFKWNFSDHIDGTIGVIEQYVNDEKIDTESRVYDYPEDIKSNISFKFKFNTLQSTIEKQVDIKFCNGIYYGIIDEDELQYYRRKNMLSLNNAIGVVPKNKEIPSTAELETIEEPISILKINNEIVDDIRIINYNMDIIYNYIAYYIKEDGSYDFENPITDIYAIKNEYASGNIVIFDSEGNLVKPEAVIIETIEPSIYISEDKLPEIMSKFVGNKTDGYHSEVLLQDTAAIDDNYVIGNNNYFIYACPKRLAFDNIGNMLISFNMPDITEDLIKDNLDEHTTPVYTNGDFDDQNLLIKLDEYKMEYMGEFEYTNSSNYTETYVMWKSNGFFTRGYEDQEFNISVTTDYDNSKTSNNQVRLVNTASLDGASINDDVVFIDTFLL